MTSLLPESLAADPDAIERCNAALRTEIALVRGGLGDAAQLRRALRESVLLVLPWDDDESVVSAEQDGIRWVYAFTSEPDVARYALRRGAARDTDVPYLAIRGERLLDVRSDVPWGVAIDVAGAHPFLLPQGAAS